MLEISLGVALFTIIVMTLVGVILTARTWLVATGEVEITINAERTVRADVGRKLLGVLADHGIYLPSACGGRGTCGQCRVTVIGGGGLPTAVETALLSRSDLAAGARLSCQLGACEDLAIEVPSEILGVRKLPCIVRSNPSVATLMKELVLELPPGEAFEFRAGAYIQITAPPHRTAFSTFAIDEVYRGEWERLGLWKLAVTSDKEATRAYSIASYPGESTTLTLIVRIATPPPGASASVPPGVVSSYLFNLRPGDAVEVSGPYGTFFAADGDREMIVIGGGAGMAPLRSIILDQLLRLGSARKISFWYGARNRRELFYDEQFDGLAADRENFRWCVALSEPRDEESWQGERGFVHEVVHERYLKDHPAPEECEYYLCGPPMMIQAVLQMLYHLGVERESIHFDDFGA
ncbi:MAG: NADH:ubiquinone reductase (Na(+)-transporting) subunit F [Myxococcales bacterium]|nr:MAG: NADH:ubiquinone reductase (Na(+)-transporting) subunit F [Myxococcales bacterium]